METKQKTPVAKILDQLNSVHDARLQVIVTSAFVELVVNTLIDAKAVHAKKITNDTSNYPLSVKLTLLHELGQISDHHFKILNWLRLLRNEAAHKWDFKLEVENLQIFEKIEFRDPKNFPVLCRMILAELFMTYIDDVGMVVAPDMCQSTTTKTLKMSEERPAIQWLVGLTSDPKKEWVEVGTPDKTSRWKEMMESANEGLMELVVAHLQKKTPPKPKP